ncbi:hypothetical protein HG535_0C03880 [Zygotorulaspora mrakii]|uniref:Mitochondrial translation factor ATP22 n=1 Tax=Zygotorulaspora mrakii TaxID=42260 RepID=A0A7H9B0Y2_ZYGMR|nr:uncharacterized protein HG535_0C03880 [Zygotorulaspora mrakii]QLG72034.1 hypothetical protein HG535_0C03880 [Zygotorulaspora mrakii]
MLRYRLLLHKSTPQRWFSTILKAPVDAHTRNPTSVSSENIVSRIFEYVDGISRHDICRSNSEEALKLFNMLKIIEQGHDMRRVKNKLTRRFKIHYSAIFYALRKVTKDTAWLDMILFRKIGPRQCMAFHKCLSMIIECKDINLEQKRKRMYDIISFQHDLFPEASQKRGIIIPEIIHKWCWENLPKQNSFDHYYFLIKNDVHLSSSLSVRKLGKRLMQGSEMELQLASLQIFLQNDAHKNLFFSKFSKLHSFDSMLLIINRLIYLKDFRNIKVYLSALLFKMDTGQVHDFFTSAKSKQLLFVKFNNALLYYLSQSQNIEMFLETFTTELQFMKKMGLMDEVEHSLSTMNLLHKPLLFITRLLRKKGMHEEVFKLISTIQKLPVKKNYHFNQFILNELIASFRSFNDPKLTCQYVISGFKKVVTCELLNDMGLWSAVFHSHHHTLSKDSLYSEIQGLETLLPTSMQVNSIPSCAVLTEIYRVVLATNARIMNQQQYQDFILNLYSKYTTFLKQKKSKLKSFSHDTGILNVFLHHIRFELKNFGLLFEILKDFYNQRFQIGIRNTTSRCPFSLVLYKNYEVSQSQVDYLLSLMHEHRLPLNFQFCTAMVIRYLNLNNPDEALTWYKRIVHAGFTINHALLIQAIEENGWEYPVNFDKAVLQRIDKKTLEPTDDSLFIEDDDELIGANNHIYSIDQEDSLRKLINLVEHIQ